MKWIQKAVANAYALTCLTDYLLRRGKRIVIRHSTIMKRIPWKDRLAVAVAMSIYVNTLRLRLAKRSRYGSIIIPTKKTREVIDEVKDVLRKLLVLLFSPSL